MNFEQLLRRLCALNKGTWVRSSTDKRSFVIQAPVEWCDLILKSKYDVDLSELGENGPKWTSSAIEFNEHNFTEEIIEKRKKYNHYEQIVDRSEAVQILLDLCKEKREGR